MNMLTQHKAQLYLAEQLPERIAKDRYGDLCWIIQIELVKVPHDRILETEWQQIALWVEEKMTDEQWFEYRNTMKKLWSAAESYMTFERWLSQATYITRATAMKEAGIKL